MSYERTIAYLLAGLAIGLAFFARFKTRESHQDRLYSLGLAAVLALAAIAVAVMFSAPTN